MAIERTIRWLKTLTADESIVWADVAELDKIWRASSTDVSYVPRGRGDWGPFTEAVLTGALLQMPRLMFLRLNPPAVSFATGRFRFSFARDFGAAALPIAVATEDLSPAQELLGFAGARVTKIEI